MKKFGPMFSCKNFTATIWYEVRCRPTTDTLSFFSQSSFFRKDQSISPPLTNMIWNARISPPSEPYNHRYSLHGKRDQRPVFAQFRGSFGDGFITVSRAKVVPANDSKLPSWRSLIIKWLSRRFNNNRHNRKSRSSHSTACNSDSSIHDKSP